MTGETYKPMPVAADLDLNSAAQNKCDSINMANYHRAMFLIQYQTIGGAANYVKLYSGATYAACTSALTFRCAFGSAAQGSANADVLAAWARPVTCQWLMLLMIHICWSLTLWQPKWIQQTAKNG